MTASQPCVRASSQLIIRWINGSMNLTKKTTPIPQNSDISGATRPWMFPFSLE